ncbi:3-oxo-5-alpha-steroid 4-dehydrogenase-domain-containing protein [Dichotomocladium elegans]|nr:3-oxo-5-alpha-steroid 4-dehydrogenase-domain-containing protein [Dichotomocladium elegans]
MLTSCIKEFITWWRSPAVYDAALKVYGAMPPIVAPILFYIDAPYGRFAGNQMIGWNLPGKLAWSVMEAVSPVVYSISIYLISSTPLQPSQKLLGALWLTHYANRAIIHPYRAPSVANVHIVTFVCSVIVNVLNGYTNGVWNARRAFDVATPRTLLGVGLWFTGLVINIYHDSVLFRLRKQSHGQGPRYFVPHDGLFRLVSCPNYFGEIVEWMGYAIVAYPSAPAAAFVALTAANLIPRAKRTQAWYRQKFPEYPSSRRAVIPWIY